MLLESGSYGLSIGIKMNDFWKEHYWVAIVIGVCALVLVIILIVIAILCYRRYSRYDYTALKEYLSLPAKLQKEKQLERDTIRDTALLNCQFYLRAHAGKYTFSNHLPDMGSRLDKHWFLVGYTSQRKDVLMSICKKANNCTLPFTSNTHCILRELLTCFKHPYLWPVLDIDLLEEQDLVVLVQSYNPSGSLKDYIYNENPKQDWDCKYGARGRGLALKEIQLFGRQILEALLYLQDYGFPQHCHVQSGNVILEKKTCKLSGYENILLGHTSRLFPMLCQTLKEIPEAFDSLTFGHLLYEMGAGCALDDTVVIPDRTDLNKLKNHHVVEKLHFFSDDQPGHTSTIKILEFIFDANGAYPSLKEIAECDFFKNVKLKALGQKPPTEVRLTSAMRSLLKTVKKGRILKTQSSRRGPRYKQSRSKRSTSQSSLKSNEVETVLSNDPMTNESLSSAPSAHSTPVPPPPPPPPPPLPPMLPTPVSPTVVVVSPSSQPSKSLVSGERGALLSDIRRGLTLKKTSFTEWV